MKTILNEKGQVVGYKYDDGTYLDSQTRLAARVRNGVTYDSNNRPMGNGDQGMRALCKDGKK